MRNQKFRMVLYLAIAALSAGGITVERSTAQDEPPPVLSDEERRRAMQRLVEQLQRQQETLKQGVSPAGQGQAPTAPGTVPGAAPTAPAPIPNIVQRAPLSGGQVQLSYDNADLYEFINQITDTLGITPIVIDPEVKGSVTIHSSAPMSRDDLLPLFNLILKNNNAALVKQGDIYQIVPISSGLKKGLEVIEHLPPSPPAKAAPSQETGGKPEPGPAAGNFPAAANSPASASAASRQTGSPTGPAQADNKAVRLATHVIRAEFIPVRDLMEPIRLLMTEGGVIMPYDRLNLLIITDYSDSITKILEIVHLLDDRFLDADLIDLIKIKSNASADVVDDLKKIFGSGTKDSATGISFVSLDRLNAILVMANSKRAIAEVKKWIKELDATTGRSVQTYVYAVENSTASNIASILTALYGGDTGTGSSGGGGGGTGAFGTGRVGGQGQGGLGSFGSQSTSGTSSGTSVGGAMGTQGFQGSAATGGFAGGGGGGGGGGFFGGGGIGGGQQLGPRLNQQPTLSSQILRGGAFTGLQDTVRVVVDDINNSLIIQASSPDYAYLMETIRKMDVLPRQAIIDARIFEVDLTDALSFGISANLQGVSAGEHLTTANNTAATGALTANTFAFIGNSREILMALNALRTKTKVRILEAPSVLALDGTMAKIVVGAEVPYPGTSYVAPAGGATSSVQYRDTGISLIVMPRISASGSVTLDIAQEVSSPGAPVPGLGPTFSKTSVATTLSVKDGQTVAIAGLIRNSDNSSRSGIPFFSNIPLLGSVFGQSTKTANRTELLILITPHVIRTTESFQEKTQDLKDSLHNVRKMVDKNQKQVTEELEDAREQRNRQEAKRQRNAEPPPAEKPDNK